MHGGMGPSGTSSAKASREATEQGSSAAMTSSTAMAHATRQGEQPLEELLPTVGAGGIRLGASPDAYPDNGLDAQVWSAPGVDKGTNAAVCVGCRVGNEAAYALLSSRVLKRRQTS